MEALYILLVLLLVTRACGELAERLGQPALIGELISGILLGTFVVHRYPDMLPFLTDHAEDDTFRTLADLGVFFLMLLAGLEMKAGELMAEKSKSVAIAVGGMVIPFATGLFLGWWFLPDSDFKFAQTFFIGTSLGITAIPVAVKVLMDLKMLDSRIGRLIVSAAILDDVFGLVLLALLTGLINTGTTPTLVEFGLLVLKVATFFATVWVLGRWVVPGIARRIRPLIGAEQNFSGLLIVSLGYAILAEWLGLHFILGAFMAGLLYSEEVDPEHCEEATRKVRALTFGFLAPVFFASIGLHLDLSAVTEIPLFVGLLIFVAVAGKFVGAGGPALAAGVPRREAAAIGVGMSARGAVEVIIADIALRAGLFEHPTPTPSIVAQLFSATVIMAVVTTILAPILLRWLVSRRDSDEESSAPSAA